MTPPPPPPDYQHWIDNFMLTAFAAFAGFMGYLMRTIDTPQKVRWLRATVEAFSSGVIGLMTVLMCRAMGLPFEWMGVSAGLLGWLGSQASVQLLERIVYSKLGIDRRESATDRRGQDDEV